MISYRQIIEAIEREDMIEAHRLVRERKARAVEIKTDLQRLAPIIAQQGGVHSKEVIERALTLVAQGQAKEAQAILAERMTAEQIQFGHLLMELLGFEDGQPDNIPQSVDLTDTKTLIEQAFQGEASDG